MGCVQSYFRKAHNAGLSPSSTQGSDNAGLIDESPTPNPKKQTIADDQPLSLALPVQLTSIPAIEIHDDHPPGTNGSSKTGTGLLGPGVAALAASTGTVAILGATADKTKAALESVGDNVKQVREDVTRGAADLQRDVQEAVRGEAEMVKGGADGAVEAALQEGDSVKQQVEAVVEKVSQTKEELMKDAEQTKEDLLREVEQVKDELVDKADQGKENLSGMVGQTKVDLLGKAEQTKDDFLGKAEQAQEDLINKAEQVKDDLSGKVEQAKDDFVNKAEQAKDDLINKAEQVKDDLSEKVDQVKDDLSGKVEQAKDDFVNKAEQAKDDLINKAEQVKDDLSEKVEQVKDDLSGKVEQAKDDFVNKAEQTKDDLSGKVEQANNDLLGKVEQAKDDLINKAEQANNDLTDKVEQAKDDFEQVKDDLLGKVEHAKDDLSEKVEHAKDDLSGKVEQAKDDLINKAEQANNDLSEKVEQAKDDLSGKVEQVKDDLSGNVEQTKNDLEAVADQTKHDLLQTFEQEKDNVVQRIEAAKENAESEVENASTELENLAQKAHEAKCELVGKVNEVGADVEQQVGEKIEDLKQTAQHATDNLIATSEQVLDNVASQAEQVKDDVIDQVEANVQKNTDALQEKTDQIQAELSEKLDQATGDVTQNVENVTKNVHALAMGAKDGLVDEIKEDVNAVETTFVNTATALADNVKQTEADLVKSAEQTKEDVTDHVENLREEVEGQTKDIAKQAENVFDDVVDVKESTVQEAVKSLEQASENVANVREVAQKEVDEVVELAERVVEEAGSTSVSPHDLLERLSRPSSIRSEVRGSPNTEALQKEVEDEIFPDPPPPESVEENVAEEAVKRLPRVVDVETIVKDTTRAVKHEVVASSEVAKVLEANAAELADSAATTIQATFRGHHTRQSLKKMADDGQEAKDNLDEFPPPPNDADIEPAVDVTAKADATASRSESTAGSEQTFEDKSTVPAESEVESLDEVLRAVSESTASLGDSLSALKGSETDSVNALSLTTEEEAADKMGTAATTIQASFRGFQARQNLQKIADDSQLPLPEPLEQDVQCEEPVDEDDLPPPPDECDIADLHEQADDVSTSTPRSPETGEKLSTTSSVGHGHRDDEEAPLEPHEIGAEALARLQRPQECDELPEHRGEVPLSLDAESGEKSGGGEPVEPQEIDTEALARLQRPQECDDLPEHRGEVPKSLDPASSVEVDDSSLSSAATKIQAGARGYLTRKHMNDTFSTTAPSMTDSQQSVGTVVTSQSDDDDEPIPTSDSLETEVQRQSLDVSEHLGVTAVVIANASDKEKKPAASSGKTVSLDSQPVEKKKKSSGLKTSQSMQAPGSDASAEDQEVWQSLQSGAATKIQSNYRGYSTRQRLQRENAVQMATTSSSGTPATMSESSDVQPGIVRASGEFHDMLVLPPTDDASVGYDALATSQTSTVGNQPEGHVTRPPDDVGASGGVGVGVAQNIVIKMGKATEVDPTESYREASMKDDDGESAVNAATKIQAGFRGYKVRKQLKLQDRAQAKRKRRGSHNVAAAGGQEKVRIKEMSLQEKSATKIQAGVRGFLVRKRRQEERNAAVKIQAGFRGYKVRRDVKRAPVEK